MDGRQILEDLCILTKKQPSPSANPANQCGDLIAGSDISGLATGVIFVNAAFNLSVKPQFIEALIATIFFNPSSVKCSLFIIRLYACLKSSKSPRFCVIKPNLSK